MSDERPDEFFSWRSRLSPPDALPEQGLDNRDLTWEKLAPRLRPSRLHPAQLQPARLQSPRLRFMLHQLRSTPPRLPVYRIAAACLLLLLIPAALLFQTRSTHTIHPSAASPRPGTLTAQPAPLTLQPAEASPILQSGPTPKELDRLRPIHNTSNKSLPVQTASHSAQPTHHILPQQTLAAKPQDSLRQPVPVYADLVPAPRPALQHNTLKNKQLRIVHVNELDNPSNPEPAMTSIHSREPDIRALILLKNH
jgi:hypothetical protein